MNTLDIIILICFIPALIFGLEKGFVKQLVGLLTIILGCQFSILLQQPLTKWLVDLTNGNPELMKILSFILIFIIIAIGLSIIGRILEGVIKIILLGWLNRLLGIAGAFLITTIVLSIISIVISSLNAELNLFNPSILTDSILLPVFQEISVFVMPLLKSLIF